MNGKSTMPGMGDVIALLGKGSSFEGKLTFEGTVRIDGAFTGEVFSEDTLVIGEGAQVRAEVDVGTLVLQGNLYGNVRASALVDLRAPGRLEGNIVAPAVMMEKGVCFEGACTMGTAGAAARVAQPRHVAPPLPGYRTGPGPSTIGIASKPGTE